MQVQILVLFFIALSLFSVNAVIVQSSTAQAPTCDGFGSAATGASYFSFPGSYGLGAYEGSPGETENSTLVLAFTNFTGPVSQGSNFVRFDVVNPSISLVLSCVSDNCGFTDPNITRNIDLTNATASFFVYSSPDTTVDSSVELDFSLPVSGNRIRLVFDQVVTNTPSLQQPPSCSYLRSTFTNPADFNINANNQERPLFGQAGVECPLCSSSPSFSASTSVTPSNSISLSSSPSVSVSNTASNSPSNSISVSNTASNSVSVSNTPSNSISQTNTPTTVPSQSSTPSISVSNTASNSISVSNTASSSPSNSISLSNTPSNTPSNSISQTSTPTTGPSGSSTPSISVSNSASNSISVSNTASSSPSTSSSLSNTPSNTPTTVASISPSISQSSTPSNSQSSNPSNSQSSNPSNSQSSTPSNTPSNTPSISASVSPSTQITDLPPPPPSSPLASPSTSLSVSSSRIPISPTASPIYTCPNPSPSPANCVPTEICCCEERRKEQEKLLSDLEDLEVVASRIEGRLNTVEDIKEEVDNLVKVTAQVAKIQRLLNQIQDQ